MAIILPGYRINSREWAAQHHEVGLAVEVAGLRGSGGCVDALGHLSRSLWRLLVPGCSLHAGGAAGAPNMPKLACLCPFRRLMPGGLCRLIAH
jgi:hypothetical protein